ncbi:hypothetical protein TIFTF001_021955 [Ficus carica]|uniref:AT3G52170-like helix-turn-helix domain-containing protein n=1 Tax=Ficus carica TaxID=3494 RepID=A0AA88ADP4_FICCA|nr:hypothetical protein TIFTF001_021955 [Ficus carica]
MHAVKGGWVGQTFALAKSNESEGRKSRIRRTKEERKAMVESFIKKYQKLNNGNFPSLNLTHKEVGGSFYTVREIVRDIIQENRVLGPAKLIQEKRSSNQLEEEPLGSLALGPQYSLTIDSQLVINEHQGGGEELNLVFGEHFATDEQQIFDKAKVVNGPLVDVKNIGLGKPNDGEMQSPELIELELNAVDKSVEEANIVSDGRYVSPEHEIVDNRLIINGSRVDVEDKVSDELTQTELQRSEPFMADNVEEESAASRSKATPVAANVIVETFPLSSVNRPSKMDGELSEVKDMVTTITEQDLSKVESAASIGSSQTVRINSAGKSILKDEKALEKHEDPLLESPNGSDDVKHEIQDFAIQTVQASSHDISSVTSEQSQEIAGTKGVNAPSGIKAKSTDTSSSVSGQSKAAEWIENQVDVQHDGNPKKKESNPTLDRINLESWGGASKKSAKPNENPFWAVFKARIDAFIKFWTE